MFLITLTTWKSSLMVVKIIFYLKTQGGKHFKNAEAQHFFSSFKDIWGITCAYNFFASYHGANRCDGIAGNSHNVLYVRFD
jgi:hypothetical protein